MIRASALAALLLCLAGPALAQDAPSSDELMALNFYMAQKDDSAISAELRRLQLKYPAWKPPSDLSRLARTGPSVEIDQIFAKIASNQLEAARAQIASTRAEYPEWTPPEDMMSLLRLAEGQKELDAALNAGNGTDALRIARDTPGLMRCDRVNNAWRIAEVQAKGGKTADAIGTYRAVLSACTDARVVEATLEKADAVADDATIVAMLDQADSRFPARQTELGSLRQRLLAGRGLVAAAPTTAEKVTPGRTQTATRPAAQAVRPAAQAPVATAPSTAPSTAPRPSGGGGGGAAAQAAQVGDWARCVALSTGAHAPTEVVQRGWCAYNLDRTMEALASFREGLAGGLNRDQQRDARYGMALSYLKMNMTDQAAQVAASTDFTKTQRVDIERQILGQRAVLAYKKRDYRMAIRYLDAQEEISGGIRRDLAMLRAYSYLNAGDRAKAARLFRQLNSELSTNETRAGMAASNSE